MNNKIINNIYLNLILLLIIFFILIVGCHNNPSPTKLHGGFNSYDSPNVLKAFDYSLVYYLEKEKSGIAPWYKEEIYNIKIQGYKEYRLTFYNNRLYSILLKPKDMGECRKVVPNKYIEIVIQHDYCIISDKNLEKELYDYIANHA